MSARADGCTCHMDGSFILNCPVHGERETLIHDATDLLSDMSTAELRSFIAARIIEREAP